jgi:hypothetical protein
MKKTALALCAAALVCAVPARAEDSVVQAHPAAWHVHTGHSEITLFGSMHMLPANMAWLTPDILHSVRTSEVFVFEVPTDAISRTTLTHLVDANGALPPGQSLRAMLPPDSQADFDSAMAAEHMSASVTDHEQPWLASLHLTLADTINRSFDPDAGVDYVVMSWASSHNRQVRYLESVNDQLAMLVPDPTENGDQLNRFKDALKQVGREEKELDPLLQAWSTGDVVTMDTMIANDFAERPAARKRLLTDRNQEWADKIKQMAGEWRNFFIVVGAAHLTGPDGVVALLRKDGFQVDGP